MPLCRPQTHSNTPWPADDNFQMNALVRDHGYVYMIGTPNGRFGNAHLARVPEKQVLAEDTAARIRSTRRSVSKWRPEASR